MIFIYVELTIEVRSFNDERMLYTACHPLTCFMCSLLGRLLLVNITKRPRNRANELLDLVLLAVHIQDLQINVVF
jgi:hypothetical protein